jgi:hypothetical protein
MRGRLLIVLVTAAVVSTASVAGISAAMFTAASDSTVAATADGVQNWVHLYSQSTDPDGLGGYFVCPGTTTPAATGSDAGLVVDLGVLPRPPGKPVTCLRVFTVKTPSAFPAPGVTTVTVTLAWQPDPVTGTPLLTGYGLAPVGSGVMTNPATLGAGQKRQLNLDIKMAGVKKGEVVHPSLIVTVTYTGLTVTYYQYTVPFTVTGGT